MNPLVKNAADESQVKSAEKKRKISQFQDVEDFLWVLSQRQGRRFVWRVLELCGVFSGSMGSDPYWTAYNEGRRMIGTTLWKEITEIDPLLLGSMGQEAKLEMEREYGGNTN